MGIRPFALIRTHEQWLKSAHDHTALEDETVSLSWTEINQIEEVLDPKDGGAGLAFDGHCRLYHSLPEEGQVEVVLWAARSTLGEPMHRGEPVKLFAQAPDVSTGDFAPRGENTTTTFQPGGLTVDEDERLFVAERATHSILVYDLWSKRTLRRIVLPGRPEDVVAHGRKVYAVTTSPPALVRFDARRDPRSVALPQEVTEPARVAVSPTGDLFMLDRAGTRLARIWRRDHKTSRWTRLLTDEFERDQEFATDLEILPAPMEHDTTKSHAERQGAIQLVVARRPGEPFLRYARLEGTVIKLPGLKGKRYDGRGIVRTPDDRIGFWTDRGFRYAVSAKVRYAEEGHVTTYQLDSGEFGTVWGRVFIDACVPDGTSIGIVAAAVDEPPESVTIPRTPPANVSTSDTEEVGNEPVYPPMPAASLIEPITDIFRLHRREIGRELPWVRMAEDDPFETYEAPLQAQPGRYLWIRLLLKGNSRSTPRVRVVRTEHPAHDYLRRIPKLFSRDESVANFLRRYLSPFEGVLGDLEAKAESRHVLIDPRSAPAELLPWLAGFMGLVLDERWARAPRGPGQTEDVRRTLLEEAIWLFRFRGTVPGLKRFLDIYTGTEVIIIEQFRMRGLGWGALGLSPVETSRSILGGGFRVGGAIGDAGTATLTETVEDAFATHAHRFTVMIPASLAQEEMDVVHHILDVHRPAHTIVQVCTVGAGMRVGRGLHIGLTSLVGRSGGFIPLQVGGAALGRGVVLGRAAAGTVLGGGQLGMDSRVG